MLPASRGAVIRRSLAAAAVPVLLGVAAAGVILAIRNRWNLDLSLACLLAFTLAYLWCLERLIPFRPEWLPQWDDARADAYHFVGVSLFSAVGTLGAVAAAMHLRRLLPLEVTLWTSLPPAVTFLVALALGELVPYWYHRASHTGSSRIGGWLWRIHSIHHLPPRLNVLKTSWMHPLNTFTNALVKMLPLLVLGFAGETIFAVAATNVVISYLSHANVAPRCGVLDALIATPRMHRLHHSIRAEEVGNFGNNLLVWDMVFGTCIRKPHEVDRIGIDIDAAGAGAYPSLSTFWKQMSFPFRRSSPRGS